LVFFYLFAVSIFWAVLNLVPVVPLDGGHMLSAALGPSKRGTALRISMVAALVVAVAVYLIFRSFLFPMFMLLFAWENYKELRSVGYFR